MNRIQRKKLFEGIDIYPVTCEVLSSGRSDLEVLRAFLEGGARIVQLREKEFSDRDFYQLALQFREMTSRYNALLIINDRVDISLAADADGVHLGQDDLSVAKARELAPELLIGISVHNFDQAVQAEAKGADYINIGPIFKTKTKSANPLGVEMIRTIGSKVTLPFTVMGGIKNDNMDEVLSAGARRIAVITALTQAENIQQSTRMFIEKIRKFRKLTK